MFLVILSVCVCMFVSCVLRGIEFRIFTSATRSIARYMLRQRGWLGGWVSVTCRYCIKMAIPILKLFRPSGNPIILVPAPIPNSKGNPFSGDVRYMGVRKIDIFDGNRRLPRKWCEIGRWLLWDVNRKSRVPD